MAECAPCSPRTRSKIPYQISSANPELVVQNVSGHQSILGLNNAPWILNTCAWASCLGHVVIVIMGTRRNTRTHRHCRIRFRCVREPTSPFEAHPDAPVHIPRFEPNVDFVDAFLQETAVAERVGVLDSCRCGVVRHWRDSGCASSR